MEVSEADSQLSASYGTRQILALTNVGHVWFESRTLQCRAHLMLSSSLQMLATGDARFTLTKICRFTWGVRLILVSISSCIWGAKAHVRTAVLEGLVLGRYSSIAIERTHHMRRSSDKAAHMQIRCARGRHHTEKVAQMRRTCTGGTTCQ